MPSATGLTKTKKLKSTKLNVFRIQKIKRKNLLLKRNSSLFNEKTNISNNLNNEYGFSMKTSTEEHDASYFKKESIFNPNSLISITKEVVNYLQDNPKTKSSDVTQYILNTLKIDQNAKSFKNIQRRVYDSINVMAAADIINKEKCNLFFKGLNKSCEKKNQAKKIKKQFDNLKEKIKLKSQNINDKQHQLVTLTCKVNLK